MVAHFAHARLFKVVYPNYNALYYMDSLGLILSVHSTGSFAAQCVGVEAGTMIKQRYFYMYVKCSKRTKEVDSKLEVTTAFLCLNKKIR